MRIASAIGIALGILLTVAGTAMLFLPGPAALTVVAGVSLICTSLAGLNDVRTDA